MIESLFEFFPYYAYFKFLCLFSFSILFLLIAINPKKLSDKYSFNYQEA